MNVLETIALIAVITGVSAVIAMACIWAGISLACSIIEKWRELMDEWR